jgi:phosphoribosylformylglycinamidine synthase
MWQFSETIDGIAEACKAFGTPVTGGNVSFYNETEGRGIHPTPVIGMIGIIEDVHHITTQWFKEDGRAILLLGSTADDLGASRVLDILTGELVGSVPKLDLGFERRVQDACLKMIRSGLVESAHDCSDGGLAVTLAESAFSAYRKRPVGFEVDIESELSPMAALFAETPSRIVISADPSSVEAINKIASQNSIPVTVLGRTGGNRIRIRLRGEIVIDRSVSDVEAEWRSALPKNLAVASLAVSEDRS